MNGDPSDGRGPEVVGALRQAHLDGVLGDVCSRILAAHRDRPAHRLNTAEELDDMRETLMTADHVCPRCAGPAFRHCLAFESSKCDLVRCHACDSYGTPDGKRWAKVFRGLAK